MRGLAWGNGTWFALRTSPGTASGSAVLESTDLKTWKLVATKPDNLEDIVYGNGRWIAVGRVAEAATGASYVRHPARGGATAFEAGLERAFATIRRRRAGVRRFL